MNREWVVAIVVVAGACVTFQPEPGSAQNVSGAIDFRGRAASQAVIEIVPTTGGVSIGTAPMRDTVLIDQRHLRFAPNVLAVAPGTVVEFRNSDPILHNVFSPPRLGADFDLGTYPQNESRTQRFDEPGNYVILCHVHPEMAAWVIVGRSSYLAVAGEDGAFTVQDVRPGSYDVRVWFRRREFDAGAVTVSAGTTQFDISLAALAVTPDSGSEGQDATRR